MQDNGREIVISFRGVRKAFGSNLVFSSLDLDIVRGETITIMGGSGMGKSVALKFLVGLLKPDDGEVLVLGQRVNDFNEEEWLPTRRRVSMLFQSGALFDSLNVRENIAYPLRIHFPQMTEEEISEKVAQKLTLVGLPGIERMKPVDLSGGMKKRVGLARAIATEPEVILWDEPTTGLDPINTSRINSLIRRMQEVLECTSVVVTHDMASAFTVSDRIAFLYDKRIVMVDTVEKVKESELPAVKNFITGRFEGLYPEDKGADHGK
ncbi:MAG: ABC transporter ATP-binding protein [Myxococcales bacterium]|nr:MAG: ABC transporter ATP-binding protein [Myxococcales bacterium]